MASNTIPDKGHLKKPKGVYLNDHMLINDHVHKIHRVIVHRFTMGDVEDPELYAAEPLIEWQNSEMGKWIMQRSVESPVWYRHAAPHEYGYQFAIEAWLKGSDYSFWVLKWGSKG